MVRSEIRDGITYITCNCFDCEYIPGHTASGHNPDGIEFTVLAYRQHMTERRDNYNAYLENKISNEQEHSATEGDGGITKVCGTHPGNVATFFDIGSGELADNTALIGSSRWATLHRASIKKA
jgi:hypothetical protein